MSKTAYGDRIECPFCGAEMQDDDYVLDEDDWETWDCVKCEREFEASKHISITYSTREKKKDSEVPSHG